MTATGTGQGFGAVTWWGFSPALDFQQKGLTASMEHLRVSECGIPELNILMVGAGDSRHLLKTICQAHRWSRRHINFYIVENNLELIGRHLLFLALALEPPEKMGLQEKSELYLELQGNSLIRSQTAAYLQEKAHAFIRYITDLDYLQSRLPVADVSALKFKERDQLEAIFKFWRNPDPKVFQMDKIWDLRNRQYLSSRYDSRNGAYDWDLTMKLHDRGAALINRNEYFKWREKGVAFEIREGIYDVPNKSLASGLLLKHKGAKVPARGYWGDIVTGPHIAFGIETEEKCLLKTSNGIHEKSAQDVSHYNITALFHELVTGKHYTLPPPCSEPPPPTEISEITEEEEEEEERSSVKDVKHDEEGKQKGKSQEQSKRGDSDTEYDYLPLENVLVHFLPLNCVQNLHHKSKFDKFFNVIYFSCSMVQHIRPELKLISAPKASLIVELARFMLDLKKEQISSFADRVTEMAKKAGYIPFGNVDGAKDTFARFELQEDC